MPIWMRAARRGRPATHRAQGQVVTRPASSSLSLRDEKILLTLVVQSQQLNDRLTRLEDRFDASMREALDQPDQQDLLELRVHSARLAAELSRVTIELRAEINEVAAGLTSAAPEPDVDAEPEPEPIDLRDPPAVERPVRASGWRPARTHNRANQG